ncbi:hypothetical protein [Streptomyces mirabilis]
MDTSIQIGPTGKKLLPLTVKNVAPAASGHAHRGGRGARSGD